jgi:predicted small secreted protein
MTSGRRPVRATFDFAPCAGVLCLAFLLSGCNLVGSGRTVQISGKVTRGGKPVPNLMVNFVPDKGRPSWGLSNEEGHFVLQLDRDRNGAVTGWHSVFVTFKCYDPRENRGRLREPSGISTILAMYGDPDTSPIRIEIKANGQVIDLRLD